MLDQNIIQTHNLTKVYQGQTVLNNLNLAVDAHSICGFLGPNGAGKTTTIKLLLGLTKPSSGSATIFGKDILRDSLAIRQRVGYLSQQPNYYGHMTARQILRFTLEFFAHFNREIGNWHLAERRIDESLALVGLTTKADRPIRGFSGGERQRLGIAQAQINAPDLLILDEPAAALDPIGRRDVLDIMMQLRERSTIFYSTHILEDVQRVSDSVIILDKGHLIKQAPIQQLMQGDTVVYKVAVKGNIPDAEHRLYQQTWADDIKQIEQSGDIYLLITVNDPEKAENQIISVITSTGDTTVTAFNRQQTQLEDVFIYLTGENSYV